MSKDEKLKLLLIKHEEGYEQSHAQGITRGTAAVFGKWPSYVASAIWFTLFVISLVTLLTLLIFIALIHEGKIMEQNVYIPPDEARFIASREIQSEFCYQMIAKHHAKRQEIPDHDLQIFDSGSNVFYIVLSPLNKISACSVESFVRQFSDKNIFLIFLKPVKKVSFEDALKKEYFNFNILTLNGNKILRGSPFEGKWKGDKRSLFEAALLSVWQFGGTVLSEHLLLMDRKLYDSQSRNCFVDPDLLYCPEQCASFVYDLIGETLKSPRNKSIESIVDNSIKVFCGSEHFVKTGCLGVTRIDELEMCNEPDARCMFVRTDRWQASYGMDNDMFFKSITEYCPVTEQQDVAETRVLMKNYTKTTQNVIKKVTTRTRHTVTALSEMTPKVSQETTLGSSTVSV